MAPLDFADAFGEDEFDFAASDFFVEQHGFVQASEERVGNFDFSWQAGAFEKGGDAVDVGRCESGVHGGKARGSDLADGDGFAVQVFAIAGDGFDRVGDGVAEVEDGAQTGFGVTYG